MIDSQLPDLMGPYSMGPLEGPAKSIPYILGAPEGEKYPAMELGQIHTFAGASGAGKTTLLFQMIDAMRSGAPFLGMPTNNVPLVYCAFDRNESENAQTMQRVGLAGVASMELLVGDPPTLQEKDNRFKLTLDAIRNAHPEAKLIIIDGFWMLVPHGNFNNYLVMGSFLQKARKYCDTHGITIIGITHTTKQREGNKVIDPRQEVLGSVAGAGFTSCNIVVKRDNPGNIQCPQRTVYLLPRNLPEMEFKMRLDGRGRLQIDEKTVQDKEDALENYVASKPPGLEISFAEVAQWMEGFRMSPSTCSRRLDKMVEKGALSRGKRGVFYRTGPKAAKGGV